MGFSWIFVLRLPYDFPVPNGKDTVISFPYLNVHRLGAVRDWRAAAPEYRRDLNMNTVTNETIEFSPLFLESIVAEIEPLCR